MIDQQYIDFVVQEIVIGFGIGITAGVLTAPLFILLIIG